MSKVREYQPYVCKQNQVVPIVNSTSDGSAKSITSKLGKSQDSDNRREKDRDQNRSVSTEDRYRYHRRALDPTIKAEIDAKSITTAGKRKSGDVTSPSCLIPKEKPQKRETTI